MSKAQIAAIDFGTSKIVTIIAQNSGIDRLEFKGTGTIPYDGFQDGDWNTPGQMIRRVSDSIKAAETEADTTISELYVGIPGEYIHVICGEAEVPLDGAAVSEEDMNNVQDAAAESLMIAESGGYVLHRSPAWFQIDEGKKTMDPSGHGSILRGCTSFIVAEKQFIEDIKEILGALNIKILGFISSSLGSALLLLPIEDRDRTSVLIDSGYLSTELSVVTGEAIVYHAMLPMGGGHISADIAEQLRVPMRSAEKLKRNFTFNPDEFDRDAVCEVADARGRRITFPRDSVSEIVLGSVDELARMIDLTLKNDAADYLSARSQVYLTGGGITLMRGGKEYLSEKLSLPVRSAATKTAKLNSPVYASALGLLDLTFDSIGEKDTDEAEDGFTSKLSGLFKKNRL